MGVCYEDLEIELSRCCCGVLEARILESPVDRPRARLELSPGELAELQALVDEYDASILGPSPPESRSLAERIGTRLFRLLTPGDVGRSLREALILLDREREDTDAGQRIRLSFGSTESYDPAIAALPWELLRDPRAGGRFIGGESQTQVVRYLDVTRKIKPLRVAPPLKVLAIFASPEGGLPPIRLQVQQAQLERAAAASAGRLEIHRLDPPTLEALRSTLGRHAAEGRPFHAVHFLGHGEFTKAGEGALYFERDDGSEHVVRGQALATQLAAFKDLRLVVLATCVGARLPRLAGQNPFAGSASALIAANVPAVVAMQFTVSEEAAAVFSFGFYSKLAASCAVDEAMAEGRARISAIDADSCEWATPVLFLRAPDGRILDFEAIREPKVTTPTPTAPAGGSSSVKVITKTIRVQGDLGIVASRGTAAPAQVRVEAEELTAGGDVEIVGTRNP